MHYFPTPIMWLWSCNTCHVTISHTSSYIIKRKEKKRNINNDLAVLPSHNSGMFWAGNLPLQLPSWCPLLAQLVQHHILLPCLLGLSFVWISCFLSENLLLLHLFFGTFNLLISVSHLYILWCSLGRSWGRRRSISVLLQLCLSWLVCLQLWLY